MKNSLVLVANDKESERTRELAMLDDGLLELISCGIAEAIKCKSN